MPSSGAKPELPVHAAPDAAAWEAWLEAHHASAAGVWLRMAKKATGIPSITHGEALELAICFGWIDGQVRREDEHHFRQRFTPRTARSRWSQVNCAKAEQLIAEGRMRPAGLAQVEAARADGRWAEAYAPPSRATVPDDFQRALDGAPAARDFFATLTGSARYAFLYRLHNTRAPERRARRIADYIERLSAGRTL